MRTIHLVQCVGQKRGRACAAKDLYSSPWFLKARRYVEAQGGPWFILSAKYGLVHPDRTIEPYDATLRTMGISERRAWSRDLLPDLLRHIGEESEVTFLAGQRYRELLVQALQAKNIKVIIPMQGLAIGEQLSWLKTHGEPRMTCSDLGTQAADLPLSRPSKC